MGTAIDTAKKDSNKNCHYWRKPRTQCRGFGTKNTAYTNYSSH